MFVCVYVSHKTLNAWSSLCQIWNTCSLRSGNKRCRVKRRLLSLGVRVDGVGGALHKNISNKTED